MARFFDFTKHDEDDPGVTVGPELTAELRRIANLFLLASITLVLFLARAFAEVFTVSFIPTEGYVVWGVLLLSGWAVSFVYGIYVTLVARRWGWLVLCAIPVTCVPAAVAYAWVRRQEIEREVLDEARHAPSRQKRGGRRSRR